MELASSAVILTGALARESQACEPVGAVGSEEGEAPECQEGPTFSSFQDSSVSRPAMVNASVTRSALSSP